MPRVHLSHRGCQASDGSRCVLPAVPCARLPRGRLAYAVGRSAIEGLSRPMMTGFGGRLASWVGHSGTVAGGFIYRIDSSG